MDSQMQRTRKSSATREFWRQRISRQASSGLSVKAWCEAEGVPLWAFYEWRKRLAGDSDGLADRFVPLEIVGVPETDLAGSGVEVVLSSRRRIALGKGFDLATLAQAVAVLERC